MGAVFRKHPTQAQPVPSMSVRTHHPAPGFDPRGLSVDCLLWCRADAGVNENGSTVAGWEDMSGNGNDFAQATAIEQPALEVGGLGGRPELTFDGVNDTLSGPSFYGMLSDPADWTFFSVVGSGWSWGSNVNAYYGRGVVGAPVGGGSWFYASVTSEAGPGFGVGYWDNPSSAHRISYEDSAAEGESVIFSCLSDSSNLTTSVNGSAGSTVAGGGPGLGSTATTLQMGKGNANLDHWDGSISEMLIFDGAMSEDEITSVERYLSSRYNIRLNG